MGKGTGMSGELIFIVAIVVAIFGVYKYSKSEMNDYTEVLRRTHDNSVQIKDLEGQIKKIDDFKVEIADFKAQLIDFGNDVEQAQDHNAKLREAIIELRDKLSRRTVTVRGPIAVEVVKSPATQKPRIPDAPPQPVPKSAKEMLKKTKKQIEELSK